MKINSLCSPERKMFKLSLVILFTGDFNENSFIYFRETYSRFFIVKCKTKEVSFSRLILIRDILKFHGNLIKLILIIKFYKTRFWIIFHCLISPPSLQTNFDDNFTTR